MTGIAVSLVTNANCVSELLERKTAGLNLFRTIVDAVVYEH